MLHCPLSNEIFRVVCQHWRGLKVICDSEVYPGTLDDEGITGLVPGQGSRLPNITLLKYLREFETRCSFSDTSVFDGFLQLEHITDLNVPQVAMSSTAVSALSSKFGSQIFHAYQRIHRIDAHDDRLNVQMLAKDYGIILSDEMDLYGEEHE